MDNLQNDRSRVNTDTLGSELVAMVKSYTFLEMRAATEETSSAICRFSTTLNGTCSAETAVAGRGVLVQQMCVFRSSTFTKVFHLHDLRQSRDVDCRLRLLRKVVSFENVRILIIVQDQDPSRARCTKIESRTNLMESTFVPVFL